MSDGFAEVARWCARYPPVTNDDPLGLPGRRQARQVLGAAYLAGVMVVVAAAGVIVVLCSLVGSAKAPFLGSVWLLLSASILVTVRRAVVVPSSRANATEIGVDERLRTIAARQERFLPSFLPLLMTFAS
jgi:hypothetical protein